MKEILYDEPYENEYRETSYPGFVLERRGAVEGEITLTDPALIQSLFAMTPYYWKRRRRVCGALRRQRVSAPRSGSIFCSTKGRRRRHEP